MMTTTKGTTSTKAVAAKPSKATAAKTKAAKIKANKTKITKDKIQLIAPLIALLEQECVHGERDFVELTYDIYDQLGYSSKYVRNLFAAIVGMSMWEYVYRRRLAEAYYAIEDFNAQTMSATVGPVRRAKRKITDEYGDAPTGLQQPLNMDALLKKWGYDQEVSGHA